MLKHLYSKLAICYIFLAVTMFILLNSYGVNRMKDCLVDARKTVLYDEATLLSSEYVTTFYNNALPTVESKTQFETLSTQLETIDTFINTRIWIVNNNGDVILDTRNKNFTFNVLDMDKTFLDNNYSIHDSIQNVSSSPILSVVKPVNQNYERKGYIVLLTPLNVIEKESVYYIDIANRCLLVFSILMLGVFYVIHRITIRPLNKIIEATKQYTSGKFDFPLNIKGNDEFKDLSNAVIYMSDELNSLDDYQKKFVANISHDFRSPLTSIKGFTEAMLDGTIPVEMQEKYLNIILFETERLSKLTTSLLALNSFDHNGTILDITRFDINQTIKKTAESFETVCLNKRITISLVFSDKETFVSADMGKIQQVLYNLIDNAIKFSSINSSIKVSTEVKNEKVFISVKDYGIGIAKDSLKKIWERFYKTDASRGKDKKGTGLGLSITKEIINAHKENINVISTEGVGTEFIFTLPHISEMKII